MSSTVVEPARLGRARLLCFVALTGSGLLLNAARADIFVLENRGQVRGELLNKDERPREKYVILLAEGGQITLARNQVAEVRRQSETEVEYETIRPRYPDSVAGQWELAEWCRTHGLRSSREVHLQRIIQLDEDHDEARRALGYSRVNGRWSLQDELMTARGYVRYKGDWRLPQEVELMEAQRKNDLAEKEWFVKLKRWRGWLKSDKWQQGLDEINKINDPYAVSAIRNQLKDERESKVRKLWLECLGRIGSPGAIHLLVDVSMEDVDVDVRLSAIDELVKMEKNPGVADRYIKALGSSDNQTIKRAGVGLAYLGDASVIGPLIDALVTTHKYKVTQGNPNSINTTFGTGGGAPGGLSVGSKTTVITRRIPNESVRNALVKITGNNFNYDVEQWKRWHAAQRKAGSLDARRG